MTEQDKRYSRPDLLHLRFHLDPHGEIPSAQDMAHVPELAETQPSLAHNGNAKNTEASSDSEQEEIDQRSLRLPKEVLNRFRLFARKVKEALDRGDGEKALAEWSAIRAEAQERMRFNEEIRLWKTIPEEEYFSQKRKEYFEQLIEHYFEEEVLAEEEKRESKREERDKRPKFALQQLWEKAWNPIHDFVQDWNTIDFSQNWKEDDQGIRITTLVGGMSWMINRFMQSLINLHRDAEGRLRPTFDLRNDDLTINKNGMYLFNPDHDTREDRRPFLWTDGPARQLNFVVDAAWPFDPINWLRRFSSKTADQPIFPYGTLRIEEAGAEQVFAEILVKRPDVWQEKIEKLVNAMSEYQKRLRPPSDLREKDEFDEEEALLFLPEEVKKYLLLIVNIKLAGKSRDNNKAQSGILPS